MTHTRHLISIVGICLLGLATAGVSGCASHDFRKMAFGVGCKGECPGGDCATTGKVCSYPDPWSFGYTIWRPLIPPCAQYKEAMPADSIPAPVEAMPVPAEAIPTPAPVGPALDESAYRQPEPDTPPVVACASYEQAVLPRKTHAAATPIDLAPVPARDQRRTANLVVSKPLPVVRPSAEVKRLSRPQTHLKRPEPIFVSHAIPDKAAPTGSVESASTPLESLSAAEIVPAPALHRLSKPPQTHR